MDPLQPRTVDMHVLCHADDGIGFPQMFYGLVDGVFEPEDAGAFFIEKGGACISYLLVQIVAITNYG